MHAHTGTCHSKLTLQTRSLHVIGCKLAKTVCINLQWAAQPVINPFTAPACKISRLKDAHRCLQCTFRSCNTCTFNAMRYDANPFTCQCKKEEENTEGFQILHFYRSFLSDITAVKGLRAATLHVHPCVWVWLALFWCGISLIGFSHTSGTQYVIMHKQRQVMGTFFSPSKQMSALYSVQTWFQLLGTFA